MSAPRFCRGIFIVMFAASSAVVGKPIRPDVDRARNLVAYPDRNMVNLAARNLPTTWSVEPGQLANVKWSADVGTRTFGSPVVAEGRVFIATNNRNPRDPNERGDAAVLMAFRESDGQFLWQNLHRHPKEPAFENVVQLGLLSTPVVNERRLFYVTPACAVVCADCANGSIHWQYDMRKELKVAPLYANTCSPLVVGDLVYVVTGNGRDEAGKFPAPDAPSFIALNKHTGRLVWQSNLPGKNVIDGQWSSPTFAAVNGAGLVIFPGGDGVLYGFEPNTGKLLLRCDCVPNRLNLNDQHSNLYFVGAAVAVGTRLYVGMGVHPEHPRSPRASWFLCLDTSKTGDVSLKSYDPLAPENKGSALVWAFGGPIQPPPVKGRKVNFGSTIGTPAVHDGLVYISEETGYLHCLDAATGKRYWVHDFKASTWSSPYWADGKIYNSDQDGLVSVFAHGKVEKLLASNDMETTLYTTPTAANNVLFVLSNAKLYALVAR